MLRSTSAEEEKEEEKEEKEEGKEEKAQPLAEHVPRLLRPPHRPGMEEEAFLEKEEEVSLLQSLQLQLKLSGVAIAFFFCLAQAQRSVAD